MKFSNKVTLYVGLFVFFFLSIIAGVGFLFPTKTLENDVVRHNIQNEVPEEVRGEQWIVLTATESLDEIINSLKEQSEWKILVVGNEKYPTRTNPHYPTNVKFLNLEQQKQLNYSIVKLIPTNSYARKNIGYLYAIEHGAGVIFDAEDLRSSKENISVISSGTYRQAVGHIINPYVLLGDEHLWPRGFPIDRLKADTKYLSETLLKVSIQQLVPNNGSDVDPLISSIRENKYEFHSNIGIAKNSLAPYNSKMTIHRRSAFWGLVLPISFTKQMTDIMRSYFVQPLLRQIDGQLVFTPTSTLQSLSHDDIDYQLQSQISEKYNKLERFLPDWAVNGDFSDRIAKLAFDFFFHGVWTLKDDEFINAWLSDLHKIGYQFPNVLNEKVSESSIWIKTKNSPELDALIEDYKKRVDNVMLHNKGASFITLSTDGGCGNRLPNILSGFLLSLLTGRILGADWPGSSTSVLFKGIPISIQFFGDRIPGGDNQQEVNTMAVHQLSDTTYKSSKTLRMGYSLDNWVPLLELNPFFQKDIARLFPDGKYFAQLASYIFEPLNDKIQNDVNNFVRKHFRKHIIGIQIRTVKSSKISSIETYCRVAKLAQKSHGWTNEETAFLVVSDKLPLVEQATAYFAKYGQSVITTEYVPQNGGITEFENSLYTMRVLSLCEEIVVTFGSSFGSMASAWSATKPIFVTYDDHWFGNIVTEPCFWESTSFTDTEMDKNPSFVQHVTCHPHVKKRWMELPIDFDG